MSIIVNEFPPQQLLFCYSNKQKWLSYIYWNELYFNPFCFKLAAYVIFKSLTSFFGQELYRYLSEIKIWDLSENLFLFIENKSYFYSRTQPRRRNFDMKKKYLLMYFQRFLHYFSNKNVVILNEKCVFYSAVFYSVFWKKMPIFYSK